MHAGTRLQEGVGEIQVRSRFLLHQHLDEDKEARDQHSHLLVRTRGRTHIFRFKEGVVNHGGFGNTETKSGICKHLDIVSLPQIQLYSSS